ncbi:hypothetical protein FQV26_12555 [Planococcus sp. CPCC 101016]|uniref:hypothetical protein n=1 Tax=Planococcus sp. CPCC 101016 TaxID=2599617 RepID=UPI0011B4ADBF|nr:hypothetical protein [Planococcus sp. CPCC 101016]TWT05273.1 hypothetical protein FQV26_12555 [Planococcus sp. CPCC 101016]
MENLHEEKMSSIKLEEMKMLYRELERFYFTYKPDIEELEEDGEAARMIINLNSLNPYSQEEHVEAIKFLLYFLSEYCWQQDPQVEAAMDFLLQRAKEVVPREKRLRHKMRKWLRHLDTEEQPLF